MYKNTGDTGPYPRNHGYLYVDPLSNLGFSRLRNKYEPSSLNSSSHSRFLILWKSEIPTRSNGSSTAIHYSSLSPSSQYPSTLSVALLTGTLWLYTTLASYRLHTNLLSTAAFCFSALTVNVKETAAEATNSELVKDWTDLIRAWTVCAIDSHNGS